MPQCSFVESITSGQSPSPLHPTQGESEASEATAFDIVQLTSPDDASPMPQVLWPRNCVADTWGAACHDELRTDPSDVIVHTGSDGRVDSLSAFFDSGRLKETSLLDEVGPVPHTASCTPTLINPCSAFSDAPFIGRPQRPSMLATPFLFTTGC